jgi:hypothetical protein
LKARIGIRGKLGYKKQAHGDGESQGKYEMILWIRRWRFPDELFQEIGRIMS